MVQTLGALGIYHLREQKPTLMAKYLSQIYYANSYRCAYNRNESLRNEKYNIIEVAVSILGPMVVLS